MHNYVDVIYLIAYYYATLCIYTHSYVHTVQRVIFEGGNFCEFHESSSIRENFTLKMPIFSWYSKQSVTIRENFTLEKPEKHYS